jgi:hypothetical protein
MAQYHLGKHAQSNKQLLQVSIQEPGEGRAYYYMALNQLAAAKDTASACDLLEGAFTLGIMEARVVQMQVCAKR